MSRGFTKNNKDRKKRQKVNGGYLMSASKGWHIKAQGVALSITHFFQIYFHYSNMFKFSMLQSIFCAEGANLIVAHCFAPEGANGGKKQKKTLKSRQRLLNIK